MHHPSTLFRNSASPREGIKVTNTEGGQIVDPLAFTIEDKTFPLHVKDIHTRSKLRKLLPTVGEAFRDDKRVVILTVFEDTPLGVHDVLFAACSPEGYVQLVDRRFMRAARQRFWKLLGLRLSLVSNGLGAFWKGKRVESLINL